jgi:acyl dehydratase
LLYLEDFQAATGVEFTSRRRTITETDAVLFTSLTGLMDPVFTDEIFASEQIFGSRIVPGPMIMTYAMGLTDDLSYGGVLAALGIDEARFVAPVRAGDTIHVVSEVTTARTSGSRPGTGVVTLTHRVVRQDGQTAQSFRRTLMVRCRDSKENSQAASPSAFDPEP